MPTGLVVMRWDERVGVEVVASYPEDAQIQERTLMQIYSQHEFSGEAGMVSLTAGSVNLASYYTGPETGVYIILILTLEEDGDAYEEGLVEVSRQILANLDSGALAQLLPSLFQRLAVYPTLNEEQRYAMVYNSDVKRMILNRLREEALISKSELAIWLKDQYEEGFVDFESVLSGLVKLGLVNVSSVQGLSSDIIFLVRDLVVLRVPPIHLYKDPVDRHLPDNLVNDYQSEVRGFFADYVISSEDNIKVIDEVILDPEVYETFQLLREAIVTRNDIEKLRKKGVENPDRVLKVLWENKMIGVFQDERGTEYYALLSDFKIDKIFPKYMLDTIRRQYLEKTKNPKALIRALEILRTNYYEYTKKKEAAVK